MNYSHKHDLCSDTLSLDYEELIKAVQVGCRYAGDQLYRDYRRVQDTIAPCPTVYTDALKDSAIAFATAVETYSYLIEGRSREVVKITNHKGVTV